MTEIFSLKSFIQDCSKNPQKYCWEIILIINDLRKGNSLHKKHPFNEH